MPDESLVRPGDLLLGKFRVERVLGRGGMGIVVAASHVALDERVAIKFLLPELINKPEIVSRFAREARASVKIRSEHVARVNDVGTMESGAPYMVMEYLEGADLAVHLVEKGPVPISDAVEYVLQACEALAEAHSIGIVHRDLKPANLFLTTRADGTPCVKVLDFGISKMRGLGGDEALTKTGTGMMGSPIYMSPEQLASARDVDARTDIYALGMVLFELMTGERPFEAQDLPRMIFQILHSPPTRLREKLPDAPPGLDALIDRCLTKNRDARIASVAQLAAALVEFAPERARISAARVARIATITSPGGEFPMPLPPSSVVSASAAGHTVVNALDRTAHALEQPVWAAPELPSRKRLYAGGAAAAIMLLGGLALALRGRDSGVTPASGGGAPTATSAVPVASTAEPVASTPSASASAVWVVPSAATLPTSTGVVAPKPKPKPVVKPTNNPFPKKVE